MKTDIYSILAELESTNSRIAKESILTREKGNTLLARVFASAYNPHINYWIKKIPEVNSYSKFHISLNQALDKLDDLVNRTVTGNAAIARLAKILGELNLRDRDVLEMVVSKDLRCGVSESTINKIWKGLIPTYPCLLASKDDPKTRAKIKFPAIAQHKEDGCRINAICVDGNVTYFSRNGKAVDCGSEQLDTQVANLAKLLGGDFVLDGELLCWDKKTNQPMSRKVGNGIATKAIRGTVSEKERDLFVIVVWDAIPYEDFTNRVCVIPYADRIQKYETAFELANWAFDRVLPVATWRIDSWENAKIIYGAVVSQGKEGLIIKNMNGIWEDKRSPDLVKMKECKDFDGRIVDIVEGNGKYQGVLGSMILESEDKKIRVEVGSGFSDAQRKTFWNKNIIGKIVTIEYNEKIQSKDGSWSLFLPVFIELREDKNVANNFSEV